MKSLSLLTVLLLAAGHVVAQVLPGQIVRDPEHPQWLMRAGGEHVFLCGPGDPEDFFFRGERLPDGMGECYPSPVGGDGKVFILNNTGRVAVLEAGTDWNVLASNEIGEECFATPAIGGNALFVRTEKAVHRFGATDL